jgi:hypothetical protein
MSQSAQWQLGRHGILADISVSQSNPRGYIEGGSSAEEINLTGDT